MTAFAEHELEKLALASGSVRLGLSGVTRRLLRYGIDGVVIQDFTGGINKEPIRKIIDHIILEYEKEKKE